MGRTDQRDSAAPPKSAMNTEPTTERAPAPRTKTTLSTTPRKPSTEKTIPRTASIFLPPFFASRTTPTMPHTRAAIAKTAAAIPVGKPKSSDQTAANTYNAGQDATKEGKQTQHEGHDAKHLAGLRGLLLGSALKNNCIKFGQHAAALGANVGAVGQFCATKLTDHVLTPPNVYLFYNYSTLFEILQ